MSIKNLLKISQSISKIDVLVDKRRKGVMSKTNLKSSLVHLVNLDLDTKKVKLFVVRFAVNFSP